MESEKTAIFSTIADSPSVKFHDSDYTDERHYHGVDMVSLFFYLVQHSIWIILAAFLGTVFAWFYATRIAVPLYRTTSKIYIAGSETTITLEDVRLGSTLAKDYEEVFKIWHIHERVIEMLGLNYSYSDLSGMLTLYEPSGSHLLYITISSPDPEEAQLIADTYAEIVQEFISDEMELREPHIIENAQRPEKPYSPVIRTVIKNGFFAGAILSAIVLTIIFLINDFVLTEEDIYRTVDLPVLGSVHLQRQSADNAELSNFNPDKTHQFSSSKQAIIGNKPDPENTDFESVNTICTGIKFLKNNLNSIAITSCSPDEGKSFLSMNLAAGMAYQKKKVLLIDGDFRKSALTDTFSIQLTGKKTGLIHYLSGECTLEEAIYETDIPGLFLIPGGGHINTPLPLLTSDVFDRMLHSMAKRFDIIIIDSPPVIGLADAAEITNRCDGCLLVVEYNRTKKRVLKNAVARLNLTKSQILGCILNKVPAKNQNLNANSD